ncbi:MAG TPA: carbohydrate porin, partial [Vicinamibacterales bacterium]|nr:carbohydrate porin [Vicinamibacterales bacterium]
MVCLASIALSIGGIRPAWAQQPPAAADQPSDWTGAYVGMQAGVFGGAPSLFHAFSLVDGSGSHFGSLNAGADYQVRPHLTIGVAGDISFAAEPLAVPSDLSPELFGSVRGRLGYSTRKWLAYSTGGLAWTRTQVAIDGGANDLVFTGHRGWTIGAGIERMLTSRWRIDAEYLYSHFGQTELTPRPDSTASGLSLHQLRLGVNYALSPDRGAGDDTASVAPLDLGGWNLHGQTTYVSQYAAPFRAPYRGTNSLDTNAGRETWDVTLYLGRQLWKGAALWINPEIDQGYGLSNTLGVAGFTSGEAYKVGYTYPYVRLPRAFVQQTIELGGPTQTVDAGLNQFAETRTENRVVITIGKFSVSDLFDTIGYAHDPRNDFMNWALVDAGTFDYAADAWGFTYGAAAEWYQRAWTARAAIFDLSNVPNSVDLDPHFSQYQLVYELEHRQLFRTYPGKLALVGFVTRGRMGRFEDATALAAITGEPADIAAVRRYNTRPGINLNLEQQVASDVGVFGRAGWADGALEPYEF